MSGDISQAMTYVAALVVVLALIGGFAWALRRMSNGRFGLEGGGVRGRQPRLGLVDSFHIDRQRQLMIVRRDNVEHLILIGGPSDIVVEAGIMRTVPARSAAPAMPELDSRRPPEDNAPALELPLVKPPATPVVVPARDKPSVTTPAPILPAPATPAPGTPEAAVAAALAAVIASPARPAASPEPRLTSVSPARKDDVSVPRQNPALRDAPATRQEPVNASTPTTPLPMPSPKPAPTPAVSPAPVPVPVATAVPPLLAPPSPVPAPPSQRALDWLKARREAANPTAQTPVAPVPDSAPPAPVLPAPAVPAPAMQMPPAQPADIDGKVDRASNELEAMAQKLEAALRRPFNDAAKPENPKLAAAIPEPAPPVRAQEPAKRGQEPAKRGPEPSTRGPEPAMQTQETAAPKPASLLTPAPDAPPRPDSPPAPALKPDPEPPAIDPFEAEMARLLGRGPKPGA